MHQGICYEHHVVVKPEWQRKFHLYISLFSKTIATASIKTKIHLHPHQSSKSDPNWDAIYLLYFRTGIYFNPNTSQTATGCKALSEKTEELQRSQWHRPSFQKVYTLIHGEGYVKKQ